ncbi:hypothetical protein F0415_04900 [Arenimonas fontis]|uniref:Uncharacterized protein n=1 Tax=Arenimonas fontis TaxID=2608255 RepID=A0A5B2ZBU9_9GAMM|nr:hypothetical protein F0415_04900 [Arenimonas fontis]
MPAPASDTVADTAAFEADRKAILGMLGEYRVQFDFRETVILAPAYERKPDQHSGGNEVVILVEDSGDRIVLQHLLVSRDGHVTKHWRQDWQYQAGERFEFSDEQTWRLRAVPAERIAGSWTQCVFEVSDAPRYCGTGRWNHRYGVSTWTSDRGWRPLPRREYSKREDYNALNVENRHTVVPGGWTHEQDNTKTVRTADGMRTLVREFGFNDYRRTDAVDFGPAYRYWEATRGYWARVRAEWNRRLAAGGVRLDTAVDGMPVIEATFRQADRVARGESVSDGEIAAIFDRYVQVLPPEDARLGRR